MIISHTGINNLRYKESTADRVKGLIESIASFRDAAPESKVVVSKVIPVGDHEGRHRSQPLQYRARLGPTAVR